EHGQQGERRNPTGGLDKAPGHTTGLYRRKVSKVRGSRSPTINYHFSPLRVWRDSAVDANLSFASMLTGKRFELRIPAVAIDTVEGKRVAVTLPNGAIIRVVAGPSGSDRLVDIECEGRPLVMFALDVRECGMEIRDQSTHGLTLI